jgi:2'-5' RNA ligase
MRLFIGIALPEDVRFQLSLLCAGLPNVRWVPPENFHITLRFIGEVDGGGAQDIDASLAGVRAPGFSLSLGGVGHFGNSGNVRVIWAGVEKSPALRHLHDKVESAVVRAGLPPEGQKFNPHITLARPKSAPPTAKLQEYLAYNNLFKTPPFEVTHFTLFQSFTGGEGSIYQAEHSYALTRVQGS